MTLLWIIAFPCFDVVEWNGITLLPLLLHGLRRRFYNSKINICNAPKAPKQLQRRISHRGQTIIMDAEEGREKNEGWNRPSACLSLSLFLLSRPSSTISVALGR